jgi:hypothetical protein
MLFSLFPKLQVNTLGDGTTVVTDIFRRVSLNKYKNNVIFMQTITVPDGFTVEQVADKYYKRPDYHWIIMVINDIVDIRKEWPLSNQDLLAFTKKKYGETQIYETHHYRTTDSSKLIVDLNAQDLADGLIEPITNIQYEEELNDVKREIKILSPKYVTEFVNSYSSIISGN